MTVVIREALPLLSFVAPGPTETRILFLHHLAEL